jgi:hypothetical protein
MSKRYKVIDTVTGDVMGDADSPFPEPMTDEGYRFPAHKLGARMFADIDFPEGMQLSDIGRMAVIARKYLVGASNMIGYRHSGKIEAYTAKEIGELVGLNADSKRKVFIARMLKLKIMRRWQSDGQVQFYVNPAYFMRSGQRLSLDLFLLFREELTPLLPPGIMGEFLRQARDKENIRGDATTEAERIINGT